MSSGKDLKKDLKKIVLTCRKWDYVYLKFF